jgi:hypothetical protein
MSDERSPSHPFDPVAHILATSAELVEAILWVGRDGPQQAAAAAWSARQRALMVDPQTAGGVSSVRSALYKFQDEVEKATRGSCLRWDSEAIERAGESLRAVALPKPSGAAPSADGRPEAEPGEGGPACRFEMIGDRWDIRFGEEQGILPGRKGMAAISKLLNDPARPVAVLLLEGDSASTVRPHVNSLEIGELKSFQEWHTFQPVLDEQAGRDLLASIQRINAELEDSDSEPGERGRLEAERAAISKAVQSATGLGGRRRGLGGTSEGKAVDRVRKALEAAYGAIGAGGMPRLARHLRESIRRHKPFSFIYLPDGHGPDWQVKTP